MRIGLELPKDVIDAQKAIKQNPAHELAHVATKLISNSPDIAAMWKALERRKHSDDPWVWIFLRRILDASNFPPFHNLPKRDRSKLSKEIQRLASNLAKALEENQLDEHLIHGDGMLFNGFHFYEDFGETNQAEINSDGTEKVKVTKLVRVIAERAQKRISDEPLPGKAGVHMRAIRFIRLVATGNQKQYGVPLNAVAATATNAIFGTSYVESDVKNLLTR